MTARPFLIAAAERADKAPSLRRVDGTGYVEDEHGQLVAECWDDVADSIATAKPDRVRLAALGQRALAVLRAAHHALTNQHTFKARTGHEAVWDELAATIAALEAEDGGA